jgi:bla regulator protein BlaR1
MIAKSLAETWPAVAPALANHLWQSTLFALAAALLALTLRKNHARARYGLWLAASAKFLIPFSLLVSIGGLFARPTVSAEAQAGLYSVLEQFSQPFATHPASAVPIRAAATVAASASPAHVLPLLLAVAWLIGFIGIICLWFVRWRRMSGVCRAATPFREGRELEALRRLERQLGLRKPLRVLLSRASVEPAVFGFARPVLLWPAGISEHLEDAHLQGILAHELCHVRRRDNLAAMLHMAVEAIFWFHPLVWWLGSRLVDERERACDEGVLQLGHPPRAYAESILKACEFCVGTGLACAAGVTGSDLKNRIVRIMTERGGLRLSLRKQLLLGAAAVVAVALPIAFGLARGQGDASTSAAVNALASTAKFDVASVKRTAPSGPRVMFRIQDSPDTKYYATGATVKMLIGIAYDVQDSQIEGGPSWINSDHFDIEAKSDSSLDEQIGKLSHDDATVVKHRMLQQLLADRFNLKIHHETKQLPIYALVVAKNGPKLEEVKEEPKEDTSVPGGGSGPGGPRPNRGVRMQMGGGEQRLDFRDAPVALLVKVMSQQLGRTVIDKTGLTGKYNFSLHWTPDPGMGGPGMGPGPGAAPGGNVPIGAGGSGGAGAAASTPDSSGPSIFTALQEQAGLKLDSEKGPVDAIVIDHVEPPSAN